MNKIIFKNCKKVSNFKFKKIGVVNFFRIFASGKYSKKIGSTPKEEISFPAELLFVDKSKLAQLGCIVDKEILFPYTYPYTSSTTKILRDNFADLYKDTKKDY